MTETLAREIHCLGRTKTNVVLPPETVLPDGSYLSTIYPSPTARRRRSRQCGGPAKAGPYDVLRPLRRTQVCLQKPAGV